MTSKNDTTALIPTRNDLPLALRLMACELLNLRLADCIDLQTQCKQAHWNVKGPNFVALHELFDDINESVEGYIDLLAERVVQLAGVAQGTLRSAAVRSTLDPYPPLCHRRRAAPRCRGSCPGGFRPQRASGY